MPLPLIPLVVIAGGLGSTIFAGKKVYDTYSDTKTANYWHDRAKELYKEEEESLERKRNSANSRFEKLGLLQKDIMANEFKLYAELIDKLEMKEAAALQEMLGEETLRGIAAVQQSLISLENALGGFVGGAAAGAMAGFGAFGGAGLLATASTGTAISSLSGVAATNATLAWFGGGSLAAGGLGMAGGTLVLGGIVAAPVILVATSVFAASAEKKKYEAYAYYDSVEAIAEAMKAQGLVLKQIINKAWEKEKTLQGLRATFAPLLHKVEVIAEAMGFEVEKWRQEQQEQLKSLIQLAETITITINNPLMNDEDSLTKELHAHQEKCKKLMEELERKWG